MTKRSKRMKAIDLSLEESKIYKLDEAISVLKNCPAPKFNQSFDVSIRMGVDPKKSDQQVRGVVTLPHGTGSSVTVVVIAKGDKAKEAEAAGADFVGAEDLLEKIKGGWTAFDALVTTPDMMREVGKLGKVLGPRGLMPTPKTGTVTTDVAKSVREVKAGKVEFKVDKDANLSLAVGKFSFAVAALADNLQALFQAVQRAKPASSKGIFFRSMYLSTTMGPGLKIDVQSLGLA